MLLYAYAAGAIDGRDGRWASRSADATARQPAGLTPTAKTGAQTATLYTPTQEDNRHSGTPLTPTDADITGAVERSLITVSNMSTGGQPENDQESPLSRKNPITPSCASRVEGTQMAETAIGHVATTGVPSDLATDATAAIGGYRERCTPFPANAASRPVVVITPTTQLDSHLGPQDARASEENLSPDVPESGGRADALEANRLATADSFDEHSEHRRKKGQGDSLTLDTPRASQSQREDVADMSRDSESATVKDSSTGLDPKPSDETPSLKEPG